MGQGPAAAPILISHYISTHYKLLRLPAMAASARRVIIPAASYHMALLLLLLLLVFSCHYCATAQTASNVYTTYNIYNAAQNGYSLSGLYCDTWDGSQSQAWRSQYPWTAFCGPVGGPISQSVCGKCLRVTNQDTQQSIVVRIVDKCSNGGLDLDQPAFNQIDSDGKGVQAGHMTTTYTFVSC